MSAAVGSSRVPPRCWSISPLSLSSVACERLDGFRLLAQHDLADDGLDVGVGQRDRHGEPVDELLKRRVRCERRLPGGDDEHLAPEPRRAALDEVLDVLRLRVVVVDVLLHLVEHDEGERQLPVLVASAAAGRPRRRSSISSLLMSSTVGNCACSALLTSAGVSPNGAPRRCSAWASDGRDVEVAKLVRRRTSRLPRPRLERGRRCPRSSSRARAAPARTAAAARRAEDDLEEGEPDRAGSARAERSRRRPEPTLALAGRRELGEVLLDLVGRRRQRPARTTPDGSS